jgi:hypothetical protein
MNFLKNWNLMRILRFIFGGGAIIQGFITRDMTLGILGIAVSGMALLNVGCCRTSGCATDSKKTNSKKQITDVEYEEVVA